LRGTFLECGRYFEKTSQRRLQMKT
jgi:hypothetical protein